MTSARCRGFFMKKNQLLLVKPTELLKSKHYEYTKI